MTTGPESVRAAIERDRGMYPPSAEEMAALGGACVAESQSGSSKLSPLGWCDNSRLGSILCLLRLWTCPGHRRSR